MKMKLLIIFSLITSFYSWSEECIKGNCENGKGTFVTEGLKYVGDFNNGLPHGVGIFISNDGTEFQGTFNKGQFEKGIFTYTNGDTYSGSWKNNKRHGSGVLTFKSGAVHDGEWENGEFVGGSVKYADGSSYLGEVKDNYEHGRGIYTSVNGGSIVGIFYEGSYVPELCDTIDKLSKTEDVAPEEKMTFEECGRYYVQKLMDERSN